MKVEEVLQFLGGRGARSSAAPIAPGALYLAVSNQGGILAADSVARLDKAVPALFVVGGGTWIVGITRCAEARTCVRRRVNRHHAIGVQMVIMEESAGRRGVVLQQCWIVDPNTVTGPQILVVSSPQQIERSRQFAIEICIVCAEPNCRGEPKDT
jgi:hypothetical protein